MIRLSAHIVAVVCLLLVMPSRSSAIEQWGLHEIELKTSRTYESVFRDVVLTAEFTHAASGAKLTVHGFHDGHGSGGQVGKTWKIRFMPTETGKWTWTTSSTPHDPGLDGKSGTLIADPPSKNNHGPIRKARAPYLHLPHADGHHTFLIGLWCFPMYFADADRERFYDYLKKNRMTRIRTAMAVRKNNGQTDPLKTVDELGRFYRRDYWKYDLSYFRKLDATFRECQSRGIFVDLCLFVNEWEKEMTPAQQEQYIRYITARYGAFRSLTLCVCNQTDWHYGGYRGGIEQSRESINWGNRVGKYFKSVNPFGVPMTTHDPGEDGPPGARKYYMSALAGWPYAAWTDHIQKQMQSTALSAAETLDELEPRSDVLNERGLARINQLVLSLRREFKQAVEVNEPSFEYGDGIKKLKSWRSLTKTGVRKVHWTITTSGSFGTTCLVGGGEFMAGWDVDQLIKRGTLAQLGIVARTMRSLPFWEMAPNNDIVSPLYREIGGRKWRTTFAIEKPGEVYLVYLLNGGSGKIHLTPGTYSPTRLNPRDGGRLELGNVPGGDVSFSLPSRHPTDHNYGDDSDWVLIYRNVQAASDPNRRK